VAFVCCSQLHLDAFIVGSCQLTESAKTRKEFVKAAIEGNKQRYDAIVEPGDETHEPAALRRRREGLDWALIPERVMVCVSSAKEAPRVIRAGIRIAGALGAQCYAVYVETPREAPGRIKPEDREALQRNIALAEELGAAIVRVKAGRPADGLIAFAKREGITHVVFGQTARTRWEILLKGSTLNRFLEEVRDASLQVVPLGDPGQ
jgi:two-component system sensor histidine kinase KdpD